MRYNKKGQVAFYISWIFLAIIIIITAAFLIPFGTAFTVEMYRGGEMVWNATQPSIDAIQDPNIKASIHSSIDSAKDATQQNVEIETSIFKYSWAIMLFILALVGFLFTRRNVEVGGGVA